jgi:23S rRNA (guanosine2251-2'-O)-methyltransferase
MSKNSQWIVGVNAVASSIENDAENVREVLVEAGAKNPRLTEIEENARRKGIDVRKVNSQALDGVGGSVRHQGVAARMPPPAPTARTSWRAGHRSRGQGPAAGAGRSAGPAQPRRLPALGRCRGATAVIIPKDKSATVNATVRKTSAGAADLIPVVAVTNLSRCLKDLQKQGVWIYGLAGEATASLYQLDLKGNIAWCWAARPMACAA